MPERTPFGLWAAAAEERTPCRALDKARREPEEGNRHAITNAFGTYGEMRGIVGATMPEIPALTLDGVAGLLEANDQ